MPRDRPSGIEGLTILGDRYWGYSLYAVYPDGHLVPVYKQTIFRTPPLDPFPVNLFRTVREARSAAQRIADVAPWGTPEIAGWADCRDVDGWKARRRRLLEGLLGRALEDVETEPSTGVRSIA